MVLGKVADEHRPQKEKEVLQDEEHQTNRIVADDGNAAGQLLWLRRQCTRTLWQPGSQWRTRHRCTRARHRHASSLSCAELHH